MDAVILVVPGLFVLMGLLVLGWSFRERSWWSGFQQRAVPVLGKVVGTRARRRSGSVGVRFSFATRVVFPLPDGSPMETWARYPLGVRPTIGAPIDLLADPAEPRRVIVAGGPGAPTVALFVIGAFMMVVGIGAFGVFSALVG